MPEPSTGKKDNNLLRMIILVSTLEGLLQHMQLLVELVVLVALARYFAHRMQHGGVVAPTKQLANFGQAFLRQLFGQVHGNLPWTGDRSGTLLGIHVRDLDLVIVGHGFLDVLNRNLSVLDGQQIAQGFAGQRDGDVFLVEA